MATLYTPAAKTTGLDWLAGMVQNGQQLWQQERRLAQDAQRIQLAKKQQEIQVQQFWAQQAKLADQEDFQNRKFLYQMSDDTRKFEWGKTVSDRNYGLQAQQESRLAAGQEYAQDPQNPDNQYRVAATDAQVAGAEQTRKETAIIGRNPMDWLAPTPASGEVTGPGAELLPKEGDGLKPTGNPAVPFEWKAPDGTKSWMELGGVSPRGPHYQVRSETRPDAEKVETWEKIRSATEDNLATLTNSLTQLPSLPERYDIDPNQKKVYDAQVRAIEAANAPVQRQINELNKRLDLGNRQERLSKANFDIVPTEKFQNVFPLFVDAVQKRDPIALENLRVQIQPLAVDGDPSAKQALKILDDVLGSDVDQKRRTPYF